MSLDREKVRALLEGWNAPHLAHTHEDAFFNALEACVLPDPRIARIQAFCTGAEFAEYQEAGPTYVQVDSIRAILGGDQ